MSGPTDPDDTNRAATAREARASRAIFMPARRRAADRGRANPGRAPPRDSGPARPCLSARIGRACRLLPALYLLLVFLAFAVIRPPDQVARLHGDALASFFYTPNWFSIVREQSYFEAIGCPSLFQHR
jgi:hypothetical protein